jgi:secondary thiamine-phosphate synthase enzyme
MYTFRVKTKRRTQLVDVTDQVEKIVASSGVDDGICYVFVPHTTAAVTINEHFDPDVATDVEGALDRLIPAEGPYRHAEGNSDSHIKAILVGATATLFIENSRLALGRWQGLFFCEFDGPRDRHMQVKIIATSR